MHKIDNFLGNDINSSYVDSKKNIIECKNNDNDLNGVENHKINYNDYVSPKPSTRVVGKISLKNV